MGIYCKFKTSIELAKLSHQFITSPKNNELASVSCGLAEVGTRNLHREQIVCAGDCSHPQKDVVLR